MKRLRLGSLSACTWTPASLARFGNFVAKSGFVQALHFQPFQRKQRKEHVHVEIGDDARPERWDARQSTADPSSPFSSPVTATKTTERLVFGSRFGDLNERGNAGSIVHGAVVNAVAIHRLAFSQMVEVRGDDDVFILQCGIGALTDADNVLRSDGSARNSCGGANLDRDGKVRQRPLFVGCVEHFFYTVAGFGEQIVRSCGIPRGAELQALR